MSFPNKALVRGPGHLSLYDTLLVCVRRPAAAAEWIWDSKKSKRWNQDMQRESDERRLASLAGQLAGLNPTTPAAEASRDKVEPAPPPPPLPDPVLRKTVILSPP